jgi:hypothetical protein
LRFWCEIPNKSRLLAKIDVWVYLAYFRENRRKGGSLANIATTRRVHHQTTVIIIQSSGRRVFIPSLRICDALLVEGRYWQAIPHPVRVSSRQLSESPQALQGLTSSASAKSKLRMYTRVNLSRSRSRISRLRGESMFCEGKENFQCPHGQERRDRSTTWSP